MLWASFPPLDWGPLGWIALVPLLLLIRPARQARGTLVSTFVCSFLSQLVLVQWLRYGDASMYMAWIAVAFYFALYFPAFVLLCRAAVHRLGVPLTLAVPTIWVGLEYLRAHLMTGCSWYYLGHTQYRFIELIQISDLVGSYGVSFVVAASAAALAGVLPQALLKRLGIVPRTDLELADTRPAKRAYWAAGCALLLVAATVAYGYVRRSQAAFTAGPRIALIQGDFTSQVEHDPSEAISIFNKHYMMTGAAVKYQPDVIVWPETMYRNPLLLKSPNVSDEELLRLTPLISASAWKSSQVPQALHDLSRQAGACLIIGIDTLSAEPGSLKHFNSAVFATPDAGVIGRYDKMHRVIFGEYIPLKETLPFLRNFVPYTGSFGIEAGTEPKIFRVKDWGLVPLICYEDTVPHLVRSAIATLNAANPEKPVDCLVNLTNDGWFHGSSCLDQHLISALFRSVECRKPMVRAVNTGISAVIDGDGIVVEPEVYLDVDNKGRTTMRDPKTGAGTGSSTRSSSIRCRSTTARASTCASATGSPELAAWPPCWCCSPLWCPCAGSAAARKLLEQWRDRKAATRSGCHWRQLWAASADAAWWRRGTLAGQSPRQWHPIHQFDSQPRPIPLPVIFEPRHERNRPQRRRRKSKC